MDFDSWHVDIEEATVRHPSGFKIVVEGDLDDPSGISPSGFPAELSAADQARLLRSGMQALTRAARSNPVRRAPPTVAVAKPKFKNKPDRPVLSLKR